MSAAHGNSGHVDEPWRQERIKPERVVSPAVFTDFPVHLHLASRVEMSYYFPLLFYLNLW